MIFITGPSKHSFIISAVWTRNDSNFIALWISLFLLFLWTYSMSKLKPSWFFTRKREVAHVPHHWIQFCGILTYTVEEKKWWKLISSLLERQMDDNEVYSNGVDRNVCLCIRNIIAFSAISETFIIKYDCPCKKGPHSRKLETERVIRLVEENEWMQL